jgi:hypothetical protein
MHVLRTSNVPLSWMLVQGILFAGITMLVTARRGVRKLCSSENMGLLLVDLPAWTRKCSVCLALVNERWEEDLISKLDAQFDALTDGTIKVIAEELTSCSAGTTAVNVGNADGSTGAQAGSIQSIGDPIMSTSLEDSLLNPMTSGSTMGADFDPLSWGEFDAFQEFLGLDTGQTFWDMFPQVLDPQEECLPDPPL